MNTTYTFHPSEGRGSSDLGWLQSKFSFSFANYQNPDMMGFWTLRVINDDSVAGGKWFWKHPHSNMEIISIPTKWAVSHSDSMGNNTIIQSWEVQAMSAGSWVIHSEMNHNPYEAAKFFQIWIQTKEHDVEPKYSQKKFTLEDRKNKFQLLVSPYEHDSDTVKIHQDAYISRIHLNPNKNIAYNKYQKENGIYIFMIEGNTVIDEYNLKDRDALGIVEKDDVNLLGTSESDILILEVPMI